MHAVSQRADLLEYVKRHVIIAIMSRSGAVVKADRVGFSNGTAVE